METNSLSNFIKNKIRFIKSSSSMFECFTRIIKKIRNELSRSLTRSYTIYGWINGRYEINIHFFLFLVKETFLFCSFKIQMMKSKKRVIRLLLIWNQHWVNHYKIISIIKTVINNIVLHFFLFCYWLFVFFLCFEIKQTFSQFCYRTPLIKKKLTNFI